MKHRSEWIPTGNMQDIRNQQRMRYSIWRTANRKNKVVAVKCWTWYIRRISKDILSPGSDSEGDRRNDGLERDKGGGGIRRNDVRGWNGGEYRVL